MTRRSKRGKPKESFAGIPRSVMDSPDYKSLSGNAVKLLLELASQYRGYNNGDLTVANSILKNRGFNSKATITSKKGELLRAGMITETRKGRFINPGGACALYALTWQSIDECGGKLEVKPTNKPHRAFSAENKENPRPQNGHGSSLNVGRQRQKDTSGRFSSSSKVGRFTVVT
jgi:hypothetical protein